MNKGVTAWVPIDSISEIKKDNGKSVNVKYVETGSYGIKKLPNRIKRIYPKCDLSILLED